MGFVPVKLNGATSFTDCFMDPIVIRKSLLDLRGHSNFDRIGSSRCTMVKSDNLAALQSIYNDKLAQKRRRPNTNMWLWLAEFVTNPFWIRSISLLTRAPTRQGSRSERPQPIKASRSDSYVQMRQIILMAAIFQQAPEKLFRIWNNWVWFKCG